MIEGEVKDLVFNALATHGPDLLMMTDTTGRIEYVNRALDGLTVEDVVGTNVSDHVPESSQAAIRACFARVLETRQPDEYKSMYVVSDELSSRWVSTVVPCIEEDLVTRFVIIAKDVTHQSMTLIERDRMFELSADLLCVLTPEAQIRSVNRAWTKVLGYEPEELVGRGFIDFVHPDDREASVERFRRGSQGLAAGDGFTNRYLAKDGSVRYLQWSGAPDKDAGLIFAAARDVTAQRGLEEQLRQAQKMEAVGQLAGGIAHDFNNLMQAVLGNVHFAKSADPTEEMRGYLADVEQAAEKASQLTSQLLAYSRKQALQIEEIDLNALTRQIMGLLRRVIPEHIEVDFIAGHKLGLVSADRSQIEQLLMNLCINARDALTAGGRITIETEHVLINGTFRETHPWAKPGRYVLLSVSDTGEGMSQEVKERVFEPFFTTKPFGEGTGLGLSVVYGVVQQHGGMVHVYSELGKGTTIKVYLPITERLAAEVGSKLDAGKRKGTELILLAEDEELVRNVVTRFLERAGYRVLTASNGGEALKLSREHDDISLAILDVVMPDLGGPEAYAHIHESRPDLPVIFASGYRDRSRFNDAVPSDAVVLAKPFKMELLLSHVKRLLDGDAT